jgi:hypothetical protein
MGEFSEIFLSPRSLPPSESVSIEGLQLRGDSIEGSWGLKVIGFEVSVGEGVMDWIMADRDDSGCHVETIACAAGGRGDPAPGGRNRERLRTTFRSWGLMVVSFQVERVPLAL